MNYAVGEALNLDLMLMNFPTDKLKFTCDDCKLVNNDYHKLKLVKKIFRESIKIILNDIIDNNNTFELPTGSKKCDIHINSLKGEEFKRARQNGMFKDVDLLGSWFTGNVLTFNMYSNNRKRTKRIYLNKEFKDKITDNTNKGKQYC